MISGLINSIASEKRKLNSGYYWVRASITVNNKNNHKYFNEVPNICGPFVT